MNTTHLYTLGPEFPTATSHAVDFALGFRNSENAELKVALGVAHSGLYTVTEGEEIPATFSLEREQAKELVCDLIRLGLADEIIDERVAFRIAKDREAAQARRSQDSATHAPHGVTVSYPCANVAALGPICTVNGAQQVTAYPHAALFEFRDAAQLQHFLDAKTVGITSLFQPQASAA